MNVILICYCHSQTFECYHILKGKAHTLCISVGSDEQNFIVTTSLYRCWREWHGTQNAPSPRSHWVGCWCLWWSAPFSTICSKWEWV